MKRLINFFKTTRLFAFNELERNAWVARQASLVLPGSRVLDIGAGSCPYRKLFDHCEYKSQDFKALKDEQLNLGAYGQIDYVSDATEIPVPDSDFEVVLCTEVLEHVPEPVNVVKEIVRILKPGGKLILTAPLGAGLHQEPYHFYGGFTPFWYEKFLGAAGFENLSIEPNAGFFKFYSQESLRFLQLSLPTKLQANLFHKLLWAPLWLICFPLLGVCVPILCSLLDRLEGNRRFTVGYHVTAIKAEKS